MWGVACCTLLDVAERGLRLQARLKMGLSDFCGVLSASMKYSAVDFVFVQNGSFVSGHVRSWFVGLVFAELLGCLGGLISAD